MKRLGPLAALVAMALTVPCLHGPAHADAAVGIRLFKPVDWISGAVPVELRGLRHDDVHQRFFSRNKFNALTSESLSALEQDARRALIGENTPTETALLESELATLLAQNRPTPPRVQKAMRLINQAIGSAQLPASVIRDSMDVQTFVRDMTQERLVHRPLRQINWAIANQCPLCCKGCYFNFRSEHMTLDQAQAVAHRLRAEGVREVILTGGDPLVANDFVAYVNMLHGMGFQVAVDTTGYTLTDDVAKQVAGKLAFVGLPIDGHTEQLVGSFRKGKPDTLERAKQAIRLLQAHGIPVKINTTVTQKNVAHLQDIATMLEREGLAPRWGWSVFQWWSTRAEPSLIKEFAVDDETFTAAASTLKASFPKMRLRVGSVESRSRQYFEVMTNGDVLNYSEGAAPGSVIMGNLLKEQARNVILSPALDKRSSKFRAWFPRQATQESGQQRAGVRIRALPRVTATR